MPPNSRQACQQMGALSAAVPGKFKFPAGSVQSVCLRVPTIGVLLLPCCTV
jgi:hypothetical protein